VNASYGRFEIDVRHDEWMIACTVRVYPVCFSLHNRWELQKRSIVTIISKNNHHVRQFCNVADGMWRRRHIKNVADGIWHRSASIDWPVLFSVL
jgi:hypothetical protein